MTLEPEVQEIKVSDVQLLMFPVGGTVDVGDVLLNFITTEQKEIQSHIMMLLVFQLDFAKRMESVSFDQVDFQITRSNSRILAENIKNLSRL